LLPGRLEQPDRLTAVLLGLRQLAGAPGQEVGQAELDRRPPRVASRARQQPVNRPQRPDSRLGAGFRPVVNHPFRLPVHCPEHVEAARVGGRQDLDQLGKQVERLPECLALLSLADRIEQDPHRLLIARQGRTGEMQRGLGQPPGLQQRPGGLAMQGALARPADLLVDTSVISGCWIS